MYLRQLFLGLGLTFLAAKALPQNSGNSLKLREAFLEANGTAPSLVQERALPPAAPTQKAIGAVGNQRDGLYVPFLYAGWMDPTANKWERYQCDAQDEKDNLVKVTSPPNTGVPHRILTDGLASCISISVISRHGTIKTHIPPYVCDILHKKKVKDPHGVYHRQAHLIKKAAKQLKSDHLKNMGGEKRVTVVAISGPYAGPDLKKNEKRATDIVRTLFGLNVNNWAQLDEPHLHFDGERSTTVDMITNPPTFYKENTLMQIHVP